MRVPLDGASSSAAPSAAVRPGRSVRPSIVIANPLIAPARTAIPMTAKSGSGLRHGSERRSGWRCGQRLHLLAERGPLVLQSGDGGLKLRDLRPKRLCLGAEQCLVFGSDALESRKDRARVHGRRDAVQGDDHRLWRSLDDEVGQDDLPRPEPGRRDRDGRHEVSVSALGDGLDLDSLAGRCIDPKERRGLPAGRGDAVLEDCEPERERLAGIRLGWIAGVGSGSSPSRLRWQLRPSARRAVPPRPGP